MKKIISVLTLGTLVFGSAAAKTSVNLAIKSAPTLWAYNNNGETYDEKFDTVKKENVEFFDMKGFNKDLNDNLQFKASGDVLDYNMIINPKLSSGMGMKAMQVKAHWGAFRVATGFHADGESYGFRVKKDVDAGGHEGVLFENFKLGSTFANSYSGYSDNQLAIGTDGAKGIRTNFDRKTGDVAHSLGIPYRALYAQAGFTVAVPNSDATFDLLGTAILPHGWSGSNGDNTFLPNETEFNGGHIAWTAFAMFNKPSVIKIQGFAKVNPHCAECNSADMVVVPGFYVDVLAIKNLEAVFGASMSVVDRTVEDYNFDIRARYAFNSAFSLTYYWNLSVANGDVIADGKDNQPKVAKNIGLYEAASDAGNPNGTQFSSQIIMWNNLHARYKINDTFTAMLGIGALTDLANGINVGPQKAEGTTLSITPMVQIYAANNASISVGFNASFQGVGKEEHPVNDDKGDETVTKQGVDIGFAIPVCFRVKM